MAVYSEPIVDEILFNDIGDAQSVLILGCPLCSNLSYCIQDKEDFPFSQFSLAGLKPLCVSNEADRLSSLLQQKGKAVEKMVFTGMTALCGLNEKATKKVKQKSENMDTIVTLSCDLGKEKIEELFPDKKIVAGMDVVGIFGVTVIRKLNKYYIDRDKVIIKKVEYTDP